MAPWVRVVWWGPALEPQASASSCKGRPGPAEGAHGLPWAGGRLWVTAQRLQTRGVLDSSIRDLQTESAGPGLAWQDTLYFSPLAWEKVITSAPKCEMGLVVNSGSPSSRYL